MTTLSNAVGRTQNACVSLSKALTEGLVRKWCCEPLTGGEGDEPTAPGQAENDARKKDISHVVKNSIRLLK